MTGDEQAAAVVPVACGLVCAVCASKYRRTGVHVYSGRCANGHAVPEVAFVPHKPKEGNNHG